MLNTALNMLPMPPISNVMLSTAMSTLISNEYGASTAKTIAASTDPSDMKNLSPIELNIKLWVSSGFFAPSLIMTVLIPKSVKIPKSATKEIIVIYDPNSDTGSNLAIYTVIRKEIRAEIASPLKRTTEFLIPRINDI